MEDLDTFTKWTWAMTAIAQALLLCLLVARRNANIYPAFTAYIFMTLAQSGLLYVAIRGSGFSFTHFLPHRVGDAGRRDGGLARLPSRNLPACSRSLSRCVAASPLDTAHLRHSRPFICAPGRQPSIETVVKQRRARAGTRCSRRYRHAVALRPLLRYCSGARPLRLLAVGLCLYSCVAVLNDAILERWVNRYVFFWNLLGMAAFLGCLLLWSWAFRRRAPQTAPSPMFVTAPYT